MRCNPSVSSLTLRNITKQIRVLITILVTIPSAPYSRWLQCEICLTILVTIPSAPYSRWLQCEICLTILVTIPSAPYSRWLQCEICLIAHSTDSIRFYLTIYPAYLEFGRLQIYIILKNCSVYLRITEQVINDIFSKFAQLEKYLFTLDRIVFSSGQEIILILSSELSRSISSQSGSKLAKKQDWTRYCTFVIPLYKPVNDTVKW